MQSELDMFVCDYRRSTVFLLHTFKSGTYAGMIDYIDSVHWTEKTIRFSVDFFKDLKIMVWFC